MELQREAVAQDKLNVSVRMEELMPLIIGQLKMLLGVPVHVSRRSYICHKTIFGRPFFNQCWSKWSTSSFKFSSFASNLVSPSLSLSLSLSHPCPCGTLHLVCQTNCLLSLVTFYPQVPQRETFSFAPGEHGITDWVSADTDPSKCNSAPSSSLYPSSLFLILALLLPLLPFFFSSHSLSLSKLISC